MGLNPCLQNPHRLSNVVAGLRVRRLSIPQDPTRSKLVGVNHWCQAVRPMLAAIFELPAVGPGCTGLCT
jgi:hypothetical protein